MEKVSLSEEQVEVFLYCHFPVAYSGCPFDPLGRDDAVALSLVSMGLLQRAARSPAHPFRLSKEGEKLREDLLGRYRDGSLSWDPSRERLYLIRIANAVFEEEPPRMEAAKKMYASGKDPGSWHSRKSYIDRQLIRLGMRPLARFLREKDEILPSSEESFLDIPIGQNSYAWEQAEEIDQIYMRLLSGDESRGEADVRRGRELFSSAANACWNSRSRDGESFQARMWRLKDELLGRSLFPIMHEKKMSQHSAFMAAMLRVRDLMQLPCRSEADLEAARQAFLQARAEFDKLDKLDK